MNQLYVVFIICCLAVLPVWATPLHTAIDSSSVSYIESLLSANPELRDAPNEAGEPPLIYAARKGNLDAARILIDHRANLSQPNGSGFLPVHVAAQEGQLPILRLLIDSGADPRAVDIRNGGTALHWAADGGHCETIDFLISQGLDIQTADRATFTPLMRAASQGHRPAFDLLLARGARLNVGADLSNGVMAQAAGGGNIEIAQFLIDRGFDVNARSENRSAPIHIAVWRQKPEMIRFLFSKGARLVGVRNRYGLTPMHSAAYQGDTLIASILLEHGATVNDSDLTDHTLPIHTAADRGQIGSLIFLLKHGADIDAVNHEGFTPLSRAIMFDQADAAEFLINRGAMLNPRILPANTADTVRFFPPLLAVRNNPRMMNLLLDKGADPNGRNPDGTTALYVSTYWDSLSCMEALLNKKANPNLANSAGRTPLFSAVQRGKLAQMDLLLASSANPNLADNDGLTPLHAAAIQGNDTAAIRLIAAGAEINATDNSGNRPLHYAQYHGHKRVADYLAAKKAAGGASSVQNDRQLLEKPLKENEALVWYLNHSGWAVKTKNHLLVIDYVPPQEERSDGSLMNGWVNPQEFSGMNVAVFGSHEHGDHLSPAVFRLKRDNPALQYYLGVPPEQVQGYEPDPSAPFEYTLCRPGETINRDGLEIRPFKSDIDNGCGFLIRADGVTILHSGDAIDTSRAVPSRFTHQIDSLAAIAEPVDLFFFPIRGCGFPDLEALKVGVDYTISTLKPKLILPMHARDVEYELRNYARDARQRNVDANYYCVRHSGDRFLYQNGKAIPL
jgi:ankyrin repeat protein/L-ascorbate metabolism protein UlaG (beta-lactamase superfamily)